MFKKKKKKDIILEEEVIAVTSDHKEAIAAKEKLEDIEVIMDIHMDEEIIEDSEELVVGNFTYHDSDPNNECTVDEDESDDVKDKEETVNDEKADKKELSSFFEKSKKDNSKIKEEPFKEKRKSKRQQKKDNEFFNVKNQKVFIFRNKKYTKVEDFIKYLNSHFLEIDKISQEVLDNEEFYGWLSKKSGVFDDSIKQFKEIKEKIEKK